MKLKKALVSFLIIMAALTWVSRIMDSVTVIKVEIGYAKEGTVPYEIVGDATYTAGSYSYVNLPAGMRIAEVIKRPGQSVKAGEAILVLQMEQLSERRDELNVSRQKAELLLQQERLSARRSLKVSEETLMLQQLEALQKELETERMDYEDTKEEYSVNVENLKQDYENKSTRTSEQIREDLRRDLKNAGRSYDAALLKRDSEIKRAERIVNDKQKELDRLSESGGDEQAIAQARQALDRAIEDLEVTQDEQELLVAEAAARLDSADADFEDREYNNLNTKEELEKTYQTALRAEEELLKEAERRVAAVEERIDQACQKLENARVSDSGKQADEVTALEISRLREQSLSLDFEVMIKKQEKIEELIRTNGEIIAPVNGIVAELDLKPGDEIASGKQIRLAGDRLKLTALVDKEEAELLKAGIAMTVKNAGEQKTVDAVIETVDYISEDGNATVTAQVPEQAGSLGSSAMFTVKFQSGVYQTVIPIEALREDNKGYFCLVAEPRKAILGEELAAVRVNLDVLEKSTISCAVDGVLSSDMQLILSSNKAVREGDRIRVAEW